MPMMSINLRIYKFQFTKRNDKSERKYRFLLKTSKTKAPSMLGAFAFAKLNVDK